MTRNEKIALGVGAGVVVIGGVAIYFLTRPTASTPQLTQTNAPSNGGAATTPMREHTPPPAPPTPPAPAPPLQNATNVIAGHRYEITLSSTGTVSQWNAAGFSTNNIPAGFTNIQEVSANLHGLVYTLDATKSFITPNAVFVLGAIHLPLGIVVRDMGAI